VQHHDRAGLLDRLAGGRSSEALRMLADASEALGIEGRRNLKENASLVSLNRFVDAVAPESETIRRLESTLRRLAANRDAIPEIRATLAGWAENESGVKPLAENNFLLEEVLPLSRNLAETGRIGLQALDYIQTARPAPAGWIAQQMKELDRMEAPTAQVRLAAVRPVRLLIAAVRPAPVAQSHPQAFENANVRCGNEPPCNGAATVWNWTSDRVEPTMALKPMLWVVGWKSEWTQPVQATRIVNEN
jgi:hypothetical protein